MRESVKQRFIDYLENEQNRAEGYYNLEHHIEVILENDLKVSYSPKGHLTMVDCENRNDATDNYFFYIANADALGKFKATLRKSKLKVLRDE